jgi:multicomponent Na+:H+ antiporter subunit C
MNPVLLVAAGVLASCGVYLLLDRRLTRIILGIGLLGHAVNLVFLTASGSGTRPAFAGEPAPTLDPLPQAMMLTAIVITFGVTALLLALAFRSWRLSAADEVEDDLEDRRIARDNADPSAHWGVD